jgi:hypothetical protein
MHDPIFLYWTVERLKGLNSSASIIIFVIPFMTFSRGGLLSLSFEDDWVVSVFDVEADVAFPLIPEAESGRAIRGMAMRAENLGARILSPGLL